MFTNYLSTEYTDQELIVLYKRLRQLRLSIYRDWSGLTKPPSVGMAAIEEAENIILTLAHPQ